MGVRPQPFGMTMTRVKGRIPVSTFVCICMVSDYANGLTLTYIVPYGALFDCRTMPFRTGRSERMGSVPARQQQQQARVPYALVHFGRLVDTVSWGVLCIQAVVWYAVRAAIHLADVGFSEVAITRDAVW